MQHLWTKHGKTEIPYAVAGLEIALAEYSKDAAFARDFFAQYVRDGQVPDFAELLAQAGFLLRKQNPGGVFFGLANMDVDDEGALVTSNTIIGSPIYNAGIDRGDRILKLAGKTLERPQRTVEPDRKPQAGRRDGSSV